MTTRDCTRDGHIWREGQRPARTDDYAKSPLYDRHRGRPKGKVAVFCQHCTASGEMEAHGKYSGRNVGKAIPAPFMKVVENALVAAGKEVVPTSARPEGNS